MRHVGPTSVFLLSLMFLACAMHRSGRADISGPADPADGRVIPGAWVVLEDRPELWDAPEGRPTGKRLPAAALQRVQATASADGGETALGWILVEADGQAGWLPDALLAPPPAAVAPEALQAIGLERVDRFHGLPPEYAPPDLVEIHFGYETGRTYQLRREAALALERMIRSGRREGLDLRVVSAYRPYDTQRGLYLNKLKRSGWTQQTVAKPGHSEHQLGTTVDLTGPDEAVLLRPEFGETPEGRWLRRRAPEFGFAVSYTRHNSPRTGYAPEPWHYRYYGPDRAPEMHRRALGPAAE